MLRQIANQPITWEQLGVFRHVDMMKFKPSIRIGEKGGIAVDAALTISETADLLAFR